MNDNDVGIIMTKAIDALRSLELSNYGGSDIRELYKNAAMHNILIIIEQIRQARKRELESNDGSLQND
jgi:hypothetical protein